VRHFKAGHASLSKDATSVIGLVHTGGDTTELWAALQMVLMLEGVDYRLK
jgi:hypothetical protein